MLGDESASFTFSKECVINDNDVKARTNASLSEKCIVLARTQSFALHISELYENYKDKHPLRFDCAKEFRKNSFWINLCEKWLFLSIRTEVLNFTNEQAKNGATHAMPSKQTRTSASKEAILKPSKEALSEFFLLLEQKLVLYYGCIKKVKSPVWSVLWHFSEIIIALWKRPFSLSPHFATSNKTVVETEEKELAGVRYTCIGSSCLDRDMSLTRYVGIAKLFPSSMYPLLWHDLLYCPADITYNRMLFIFLCKCTLATLLYRLSSYLSYQN